MAELLQLPLLVPSSSPSPTAPASSSSLQTASIYPPFPPRQPSSTSAPADELPLNIPTLHTKLTKAEFVGCSLRGGPPRDHPSDVAHFYAVLQSSAQRTLLSSVCKVSSCRRRKGPSRLSRSSRRSKVRLPPHYTARASAAWLTLSIVFNSSQCCPRRARFSSSNFPSLRHRAPLALFPLRRARSASTSTVTHSLSALPTAWEGNGRLVQARVGWN